MAVAHFQGKKAVRYTDQRVETVGKFILWRLEQLKGLHLSGAPEAEREQLKCALLATIREIYARQDGWTVKNNIPHNMYWDIVDYHLFQASYSLTKPFRYGNDAIYLLNQHNKAYLSIFNKEFKKFTGKTESPME